MLSDLTSVFTLSAPKPVLVPLWAVYWKWTLVYNDNTEFTVYQFNCGKRLYDAKWGAVDFLWMTCWFYKPVRRLTSSFFGWIWTGHTKQYSNSHCRLDCECNTLTHYSSDRLYLCLSCILLWAFCNDWPGLKDVHVQTQKYTHIFLSHRGVC